MKLLIVLLGSNPLPVFVTIKAVKLEVALGFEKLLFVFSEHTQLYLPYIGTALELADDSILYCNLEENQRRPEKIRETITKALEALNPQPTRIHFNHTGGTKTMAIHCFTAISAFATGRKLPLTISDLDPDTHKLNVTANGNTISYPLSGSYLDSIKCKIEDLTGLHGFSTKIPGQEEIKDPYMGLPLQSFFADILSNLHLSSFPKGLFHDRWSELREINNIGKNYEKLLDYLKNRLNLPEKHEILKYFCFTKLPTIANLEEAVLLTNLYGILDFVDGKWLEYFVFCRLKALISSGSIISYQVLHSHKVWLPDLASKRDCELDVVVMQGYQLTLISCSTGRRISEIKHKAFEAVFRAHQLGGEQAKVLVVSMMSAAEPRGKNDYTLKSLDYDLKSFELNRNVFLAGLEHLQNSVSPGSCPDFTSLDDILIKVLS